MSAGVRPACPDDGSAVNLYLRLLLLRLRAPRSPRLGAWDVARTSFRVVPTDLDLLGHVNNGRYLTLMDVARIDLLTRAGVWDRMRERGWYPVVAGQTITYRRSLRLGQRFDIYSRAVGIDDRWVYVEQTFCVGEDVYARAVVRSRFLKRSDGSVERAELEELCGPAPEGLELPGWVQDWTDATRIPKEYAA